MVISAEVEQETVQNEKQQGEDCKRSRGIICSFLHECSGECVSRTGSEFCVCVWDIEREQANVLLDKYSVVQHEMLIICSVGSHVIDNIQI